MNDEMRASAALAALVEKAHPGLDLPTREDIARGGYQGFKLGWDAREVADQLPDHAAPLEPEPAGEPVLGVEPAGWSPRLEELYWHVMSSRLEERRAAFLGALTGWTGGADL